MTERVLAARLCPACRQDHPPLTTCATGWRPWNGQPVVIDVRAGPVLVTLTADEMAYAERIGRERWERGRKRGGNDRLKSTARTNTPATDVLGAVAESAVAKWLGVPWDEATIETPGRRADVAGYGVRAAPEGRRDFPIRPGDSHPMVMVLVRGARARLAGWYEPAEAYDHPEWRADRGGLGVAAWWVPVARLRSLASLPRR